MQIISGKAYLKNLLLKKPYTIATKEITDVENVFVELTLENGIVGIGACNPDKDIVDEDNAEALLMLQQEIIPFLIGKSINHFAECIDEIVEKFHAKPGGLAAIDIALHDAYALYKGISVADIYGLQHQLMPTSVTIGIMKPVLAVEEAKSFVKQGFKVLKIKTGIQVDEDIETVLKVREAVGSDIVIRVDANQGYSTEQLKYFLDASKNAFIELIEQPMPPGHESILSQMPTAITQILCADESLLDSTDAATLVKKPLPYGIFNIKLMKCGGIKEAMRIATIAKEAGIKLFWGCNDESIISISAALHAAFACRNTAFLDLDGSFDLAVDRVEAGFILNNGFMSLTNSPGLGVKLIKLE